MAKPSLRMPPGTSVVEVPPMTESGVMAASPGADRHASLGGIDHERAVADQPLVHGEPAHVVEEAREDQLLRRARAGRQLRALERMRQLRHRLAAVLPRGERSI